MLKKLLLVLIAIFISVFIIFYLVQSKNVSVNKNTLVSDEKEIQVSKSYPTQEPVSNQDKKEDEVRVYEPKEATEDIKYEPASPNDLRYSYIIPKGTKYIPGDALQTIYTNSGLEISLCAHCQLFIPECGGLADGYTEEGGCAIKSINLNDNVTIDMHYKEMDGHKIKGYFKNYKLEKEGYLSVRVLCDTNRELTSDEKSLVSKIVTSIK